MPPLGFNMLDFGNFACRRVEPDPRVPELSDISGSNTRNESRETGLKSGRTRIDNDNKLVVERVVLPVQNRVASPKTGTGVNTLDRLHISPPFEVVVQGKGAFTRPR